MRIAAFETEKWEQDAFKKLGLEYDLTFVAEPLSPDNAEAYADADIVSVFIYSDVSSAVLEQFDHLKFIATRSTGFDHIDIDYCRRNGITVSNVPAYGDVTVAEHVFGLILTISHNITRAIGRTKRGDFSLKGLLGFDLRGKKLGVIGTGRIGQYVISIAGGFGMEVIAYDAYPREELMNTLKFRYVGFEELLSISDIITIQVPGTPQTFHLISDKEFNLMKKDVILINTARGNVVDIRALLRALADGKVGAAGLDVLPEEPAIREEAELIRSVFQKKYDLENLLVGHILLRMENVYVTPHSAFYTREAIQRILDVTVENIVAFSEGKPRNVVT